MRLHLEEEAAAEPRSSASTSRGSLLTLHCEQAAAEAAPGPAPAQNPAAAEWPPASPQDPPPRLRRAAHWARRAPHGLLRGLPQPSAAATAGGGQPPGEHRCPAARAGPAATGERPAEHEGAAHSSGQGPRLHRVARKIAGSGSGRRTLTRSGPALPSLHTHTPPAPRWRRSCSRCHCRRRRRRRSSRRRCCRLGWAQSRDAARGEAGGGQARARARGKRGSDWDWEPGGAERAFKGRTRRARARRLAPAARSGKGGRSEGGGPAPPHAPPSLPSLTASARRCPRPPSLLSSCRCLRLAGTL